MRAGVKMMMLEKARGGYYGRSEGRMGYGGGNHDRTAYDGSDGDYGTGNGMESSRVRDDMGRFRSKMESGESGIWNETDDRLEPRDRYGSGSPFPVYERGGERMNQIGFRAPTEMGSGYRMDAGYNGGSNMDNRYSPVSMGRAESAPRLTRETAEEWAKGMENSDGTKGPHWTLEQAKQVMSQRNVSMDPVQFWIALCAVYSDYGKVLKKHGCGDKIDLYVDLAKAFVEDKDAQPDKLARYYEYVVKH